MGQREYKFKAYSGLKKRIRTLKPSFYVAEFVHAHAEQGDTSSGQSMLTEG